MLTRRQFLRWLAAFGTIGAAASLYSLVVEPLLRPRITRYALMFDQWPRDLRLTVAVLADFHACRPWMGPERIRSIVEMTNGLSADLIVLLGDYVAGHRFVTEYVPANEWASELSRLTAPLGVHAILGNHDWWQDRSVQRSGQGPPMARVRWKPQEFASTTTRPFA